MRPHATFPAGLLGLAVVALHGTALARAGALEDAVAPRPINVYCPVQPDQRADATITTIYEGKTIAFCCKRCLRKFEANPERYAARIAQLTGGISDETTDTDAHALDDAKGADHGADHPDNHTGGEPAAPRDDASTHLGHDEHGADRTGFAKLVAWVGRFHPAAVNFPIAMLVGAAVAELLWVGTKRPLFASAGRFCLWFGALGAAGAATLGWCFGGFHLVDGNWIMTTHRWLGTTTALWALATLVVGERAFRRPVDSKRTAYRTVLCLGVAAVLVTGFFGGAMIYGIGHYAW